MSDNKDNLPPEFCHATEEDFKQLAQTLGRTPEQATHDVAVINGIVSGKVEYINKDKKK